MTIRWRALAHTYVHTHVYDVTPDPASRALNMHAPRFSALHHECVGPSCDYPVAAYARRASCTDLALLISIAGYIVQTFYKEPDTTRVYHFRYRVFFPGFEMC